MLMQEQGATSRVGSVAFIVLAHVLFVLALVHYASPRPDNASTPVDYIAFAFIVAPEKPVPVPQARSAPPPVAVQVVRPPRIATPRAMPASPEPMTIITPSEQAASAMPTESLTAPAPAPASASAPTGKLDMESLRGLARQVEKERVPTALERVRTAEQMRARDDNKLSRAINEAKRPDCQTKYSGGDKLDLIRLIPLAIDTITDTGCKW
ncbi:hypothetical protein ACFOY5_06280 [Massilia aurea]|uniref:hypothetical protein n=1 Tax=Massilia aurea TaxID=373040 RepID=UPI002163CB9E|nr:hypothetical protein [Massilia aurea]MCS0708927.1 hypothetical protein [Massilia aurea]